MEKDKFNISEEEIKNFDSYKEEEISQYTEEDNSEAVIAAKEAVDEVLNNLR